MRHMSAQDVIEQFELVPHPTEGGWYRESYRSDELIGGSCLPERYGSPRSFGTCIYYLLTRDKQSILHRVASDEVYHFYLGDPVTMLQLHHDGSSSVVTLGQNVADTEQVQAVVPEGTWQGSFLDGGEFALMGCTLSPGYDFSDYESATRSELTARWPERKQLIMRLTQPD
jgi:uncharacterized protein